MKFQVISLHVCQNDFSSSFSNFKQHLKDFALIENFGYVSFENFLLSKKLFRIASCAACGVKQNVQFWLKTEISSFFLFWLKSLFSGKFIFRYSRSLTSVGWMVMVKKTDDCKNANIARHTQRPMFSFKEKNFLSFSFSISTLLLHFTLGLFTLRWFLTN